MAADEGPNAADIGIVLRDMAHGADDWLARGARILGLEGTEELSRWLAGEPPPEGFYNGLASLWVFERWREADEIRWRTDSFAAERLDCSIPAGVSPAMECLLQKWLDHQLAGGPIDC
jgi:hypothetical protein